MRKKKSRSIPTGPDRLKLGSSVETSSKKGKQKFRIFIATLSASSRDVRLWRSEREGGRRAVFRHFSRGRTTLKMPRRTTGADVIAYTLPSPAMTWQWPRDTDLYTHTHTHIKIEIVFHSWPCQKTSARPTQRDGSAFNNNLVLVFQVTGNPFRMIPASHDGYRNTHPRHCLILFHSLFFFQICKSIGLEVGVDQPNQSTVLNDSRNWKGKSQVVNEKWTSKVVHTHTKQK